MPIRVLHVQKSKRVGGIERYVFDLATNSGHAKFIAQVACDKRSWLYERLQASETQVHRLPIPPIRPLRPIFAVKAIRKIIREQKIDIVHSHDFHGALYSLAAAAAEGIPNMRTMHSLDVDEHSLKADRLICVSQAVYDHYLHCGMRIGKNAVVVRTGVDTEHFAPVCQERKEALRSALGLPMGARIAGMVSRLTPAKGCAEFLQAMAEVSNAYCVLFGYAKPKYLRRLAELCEQLRMSDRVVFAGPMEDTREAFACLDVTVMPSYSEGFPLTMLESSACGVPVIASDVGGIPEFIDDDVTGALVPPREPDALAEVIRRLLHNKDQTEQMASRARSSVLGQYDIRQAAQRMQAEYERCLSDRYDRGEVEHTEVLAPG